MWPSQPLLSSDIYAAGPSHTGPHTRFLEADRGYLRAEAIGRAYGMSMSVTLLFHVAHEPATGITVEDVATLSHKLWEMHKDPILALDASALTIMTIHYNLSMGTIASFLPSRPDLRPLLDSMIQFKTMYVSFSESSMSC